MLAINLTLLFLFSLFSWKWHHAAEVFQIILSEPFKVTADPGITSPMQMLDIPDRVDQLSLLSWEQQDDEVIIRTNIPYWEQSGVNDIFLL